MLGLSAPTVSLALNGRPGISERTRERVLKAAREMGGEGLIRAPIEKQNILFLVYHKSLAAKDSVHFSQLFADIIEGVENEARTQDFNLLISYTDQSSLRQQAAGIEAAGVHGVLLLATDMRDEQIAYFERLTLPIVVIDNYWDYKALDCITINNAHGVFQAIEHLRQMGHERIGYLHVQKNANNFNERHDAFFRAMEHHGLCPRAEDVYSIDTRSGGEEVYLEMCRAFDGQPSLPTAFFADNDILVMHALRALRERGVRVPEDVSIVGFDNMPLSEILDPPLTTIHPDKYQIGVTSVGTLAQKIRGERQLGSATKVQVSTRLVERKSVQRRPSQ